MRAVSHSRSTVLQQPCQPLCSRPGTFQLVWLKALQFQREHDTALVTARLTVFP